MTIIVKVSNLTKKYAETNILQDLSFTIKKGEKLILTGESGSGKSTLLRCIQGIESIDSGEIQRYGTISTIFQSFNLFPHFTVLENLVYATKFQANIAQSDITDQAKSLLEDYNLTAKINAYPRDLSGGQQQRIAVLRSLLINPDLLLMDEPTSALDQDNIMTLLDLLNQQHQLAVLIVSHDHNFIKLAAYPQFTLSQNRLIKQ